jgi:hypothetical protein
MTLFYPIFSLRLTGDNTMIFIGIDISKLTFDAAPLIQPSLDSAIYLAK